jgi:uncharacterized damage-inducible protein DinB
MTARRRPPISSADELLTPAQARRLFAYNRAVFDRFVRRLRAAPLRTVRRRREIGHQSLFDTLVHILNVQEVWIGYILAGRGSEPELERLFADPTRHPKDWAGFSRYRRRVRALVDRFLASVTATDLPREVRVFWMPGRYTASDGLLQVSFEEAHHLGEIIGAMWQDDREPPEMTWIGVGRARRSG